MRDMIPCSQQGWWKNLWNLLMLIHRRTWRLVEYLVLFLYAWLTSVFFHPNHKLTQFCTISDIINFPLYFSNNEYQILLPYLFLGLTFNSMIAEESDFLRDHLDNTQARINFKFSMFFFFFWRLQFLVSAWVIYFRIFFARRTLFQISSLLCYLKVSHTYPKLTYYSIFQCQALNEEEIHDAIQDEQSLFPGGWIHVSNLSWSMFFHLLYFQTYWIFMFEHTNRRAIEFLFKLWI